MKTFIKVFQILSAVLIIIVVAVKFIQKCSWKEAAGITIDLLKEAKSCCPICKLVKSDKSEESCG